MQPDEYTVTSTVNFLEDRFDTSADDEVTLYIDGGMNRDYALQAVADADQDPPPSFVGDRTAESRNVLDVVDAYAADNEEFARTVERNDRTGDGVPDSNSEEILDALLAPSTVEKRSTTSPRTYGTGASSTQRSPTQFSKTSPRTPGRSPTTTVLTRPRRDSWLSSRRSPISSSSPR